MSYTNKILRSGYCNHCGLYTVLLKSKLITMFKFNKTLLLLLVCTVFSLKVFSQEESGYTENETRIIPYAVGGLNFSRFVGIKDGPAQSWLTGFNVGAGLTFMLDGPGKFQLDFQGLYSEQGTKFTGITEPTFVETFKVNYINIPVTLRYYPSNGDGFYIGAGPQVGFQVGGYGQFKNGDKGDLKSDAMNSTVWDAVGTIGYTNGDFGLEARYQHGLSTVIKAVPDYRHSVIQLRLNMPLFFLETLFGGGN
jgi:hypothetical protein